mgnify:CR=1 FL=1|jgi:hypothetical protein
MRRDSASPRRWPRQKARGPCTQMKVSEIPEPLAKPGSRPPPFVVPFAGVCRCNGHCTHASITNPTSVTIMYLSAKRCPCRATGHTPYFVCTSTTHSTTQTDWAYCVCPEAPLFHYWLSPACIALEISSQHKATGGLNCNSLPPEHWPGTSSVPAHLTRHAHQQSDVLSAMPCSNLHPVSDLSVSSG